jgi:type VI secretion system protein ImpL
MVAKLDINGTVVESKAGSNSPVAVSWPGPNLGRTAITLAPEATPPQSPPPPQQQQQRPMFGGLPPPPPPPLSSTAPSTLERTGAWSLFRMLDAASPKRQGDWIVATFIVGGMELHYRFGAGSVNNPLTLPALREFRCPSGI